MVSDRALTAWGIGCAGWCRSGRGTRGGLSEISARRQVMIMTAAESLARGDQAAVMEARVREAAQCPAPAGEARRAA